MRRDFLDLPQDLVERSLTDPFGHASVKVIQFGLVTKTLFIYSMLFKLLNSSTVLQAIIQGLFLDFLKKTQTQKNSKLKPNSEKKLGPNFQKTQNLPTHLVGCNCQKVSKKISLKLLRTYNLQNSSFFQ